MKQRPFLHEKGTEFKALIFTFGSILVPFLKEFQKVSNGSKSTGVTFPVMKLYLTHLNPQTTSHCLTHLNPQTTSHCQDPNPGYYI